MIKGTILSIADIQSYPKQKEKGIRIKTGTHHIVARVPENSVFPIGAKIKASNVVSIENSGDFFAKNLECVS